MIPVSEVSAVAALRVSIACEYEAMERAMHGSAIVARHAIIAHRLQHVAELTGKLGNIIGAEQATATMTEIYHHAMEG